MEQQPIPAEQIDIMSQSSKSTTSSVTGIKKPAIRRLAHRAGVYRINSLAVGQSREIIVALLENLLRQAVLAVDHMKMHTLKTIHVEFALNALNAKQFLGAYYTKSEIGKKVKTHRKGHTAPAAGGEKKHRYRSGTVSMSDIRRIQKSPELVIASHSFATLVRSIANEFKDDLRFEARAMEVVRLYIEHMMVDVIYPTAIGYMLAAKRTTMFHTDLVAADDNLKRVGVY